MRTLFVILLFFPFLYANNVINIDSEDVKITEFEMAYFVDKTHELNISAITTQDFSKFVPNKLSLGSNKKHVWYKIKVKNSTQTNKELFLHLKNAYINSKVGIYEINGTSLIKQSHFDIDNDKNIAKFFYGSTLRYELLLDKNSSKTIYLQFINNYRQFSNIVIYDNYNSIVDFTKNNLLSIVLSSVLLILAIYHLVLYFVSRHIEYIYYSSALFFAVIFQSRELGIAANFGLFGITPLIVSSVALILFIIFLLIFAMSIFDLKQHKKFNIAFKAIIALLSINLVFLFTSMQVEAVVFIANLAALAVAAQITLAIYMYISSHPLAKYYLAANIFYIIFSVIALLFYEGLVPYNEITFRSLSFGCVIEAIIFAYMLSYMLSYEIRVLEEKNLLQYKRILQKSEKEQLGEMISIIAHQLKQPLNVISMCTSKYEILSKLGKETSKELCEDLFQNITKQVIFADDTIEQFRHFFNPKNEARLINLYRPINVAVELMGSTLNNNNIIIKEQIKLPTEIKTYGNGIVQVILNLLKNATEQFKETQKDKIITIIGYEDDDYSYIKIKDNAGGIPEAIIDKIFEQYFSTKSESDGTGLGLDLCKNIVEDKCSGVLSVQNEDEGAIFSIKLPKKLVDL